MLNLHPDTLLAAALDLREQAEESLTWSHEAHAEVTAQYRSEVGLYGDAWPGAQVDVARSAAQVREDADRADRLDAFVHRFPAFGPAGLLAPQDRPRYFGTAADARPFGPADPSTEEPF